MPPEVHPTELDLLRRIASAAKHARSCQTAYWRADNLDGHTKKRLLYASKAAERDLDQLVQEFEDKPWIKTPQLFI